MLEEEEEEGKERDRLEDPGIDIYGTGKGEVGQVVEIAMECCKQFSF